MEKKDAARILYLEGTSQKRIAQIMRVAENTVSRWKQDGSWQEKRVSRDLLKNNSIQRILKMIDYQTRVLDKKIDGYIEEHENGDRADLPLIQRGDIDALQKLFTTIKGDARKYQDYIVVMKEFFEFLQAKNLEVAKELTDHADRFLNKKREKM